MEYFELGIYKDKLRDAFSQNEDIVSLIMPVPENGSLSLRENFLGGEYDITTTDDTGSTHKEHVVLQGFCQDRPFPCAVSTDHRNLLCVDSLIVKADGRAAREITLQIYVMIHKDAVRLSPSEAESFILKGYSGNRCDMAVQAIGSLLGFTGSTPASNSVAQKSGNLPGLGRLYPAIKDTVTTYTQSNDYYGKILTFTCTDFIPCSR